MYSKFIFAHPQGIRAKFVNEGHLVKVKVTWAKNLEHSYSLNVKLSLAITPVVIDIQPWSLRVAWGFWIRRIEWCGRYLRHVTGS